MNLNFHRIKGFFSKELQLITTNEQYTKIVFAKAIILLTGNNIIKTIKNFNTKL